MTKEQLREFEKDLIKTGLENVQNIILVKNGATNGDIIKTIFSKIKVDESSNIIKGFFNLRKTNPRTVSFFDLDWWNALYERD